MKDVIMTHRFPLWTTDADVFVLVTGVDDQFCFVFFFLKKDVSVITSNDSSEAAPARVEMEGRWATL